MSATGKILRLGALAALLAGCASGEHAEDLYVAPGKYILYDCNQLAGVAAHFEQRKTELEGLIARAKQGPGGELVSTLAYDADYYSNLGELKDVRREQAEKNCAANVTAKPTPPTQAQPPRRRKR